MLKTIAIVVVVVLIAGVLTLAATKPDTFRVQRTASIKAPPEKIFPLINDLRAFNTWNPYETKDPNLKGRHIGSASGKGAAYAFDGNKEVGQGSLEIMESLPSARVTMKLNLIKPFEAQNTIEFTFQPEGDITNVTWAMQGHTPYFAKIIHLFFDMDSMVGKDFETGLANLKVAAEK